MLMSEAASQEMNCENDQCHNLLQYGKLASVKDKEEIILSPDNFSAASQVPLAAMEEGSLMYMSGYFYKRLMSFHKAKDCNVCGKHAEKFDASLPVCLTTNTVFLFFKRYETAHATLYSCSEEFSSFVRIIIQTSNYCFENLYDQSGLVSLAASSVQHYLGHKMPTFCSDKLHSRLISLIARTIICYKAKWYNSVIKSKGRNAKKTLSEQKLSSLLGQ